MAAIESFTEAVGEVVALLRDGVPSHSVLNRAASQVDRLGRTLYGFGFACDREIADAFTGAIGALTEAHARAETDRGGSVSRATRHLEAALRGVEAGELAPGASPPSPPRPTPTENR